MSVDAVGGGGSTALAQLQQQLKADQRALAAAEKSRASAEALQLDELKVQSDTAAIAAAQQAAAQKSQQAAAEKSEQKSPHGGTAPGDPQSVAGALAAGTLYI